jgi:hypothetical protein
MSINTVILTPKITEGQGKSNQVLITAENRKTLKNCAPRISLREQEVRFARFAHSSGLIYDKIWNRCLKFVFVAIIVGVTIRKIKSLSALKD